jgi:hypothetical protein
MKWLDTVWKQTNEESKKAGIVVGHNVFNAEPRTPSDPGIILSGTYPNMAIFDGINDKFDAITEKVEGSVEKTNQHDIGRGSLREVLGSELIREAVLK